MPKTPAPRRVRRDLGSIDQGAELMGCNPKTIRRRIADGTITAYRLGGLIRIDLDELEAAMRVIPTAGSSRAKR